MELFNTEDIDVEDGNASVVADAIAVENGLVPPDGADEGVTGVLFDSVTESKIEIGKWFIFSFFFLIFNLAG